MHTHVLVTQCMLTTADDDEYGRRITETITRSQIGKLLVVARPDVIEDLMALIADVYDHGYSDGEEAGNSAGYLRGYRRASDSVIGSELE